MANFVTVEYLNKILEKLNDWMPFKRKNGGILQDSRDSQGNSTLSVSNEGEIALGMYNLSDANTLLSLGIGSTYERKNALKINKDGEIFIIPDTSKNSVESLQSLLNKHGVDICETYERMLSYCNNDNMGKLLYLTNNSTYNEKTYYSGLYIVSLNTYGKADLFIIGSSLETDLSNYYTKEEINILLDSITAGDIDLTNYYTISEIDIKLNNLSNKIDDNTQRISILEEWKETPITTDDLEIVIGIDLNNDGKIGY